MAELRLLGYPLHRNLDCGAHHELLMVFQEIRNDIERSKALRLSWQSLLAWAIICATIELLLLWFNRFELSLPVVNFIGVIGFAIYLKRDLKGFLWYWITMGAVVALHVLLILEMPWTSKWVPAIAFAGMDCVDLIVIFTLIAVVGRAVKSGENTIR